MKADDNDKKLDDLIHTAIGHDGPTFDFQRWKGQYQTQVNQFHTELTQTRASGTRNVRFIELIRRDPIVRWTIAVAVVVACLLIVAHLMGSFDVTAPVYAVTDAPGILAQAATIHATGWHYFPEDTMPDGSEIPPVPIELWVDLIGGRDRRSTCSLTSRKDYLHISVGEVIRDSQYRVRLNHTEKTAYFYRSRRRNEAAESSETADRWVRLLLGDFTDLASSVRIGAEEVDGQWCEIWQWQRVNQVVGSGYRTRFWFSPETGQTKRVQSWTKWSNTDWMLRQEYTRIELDVDVPPDVFAMEVPAGYEARNTKETMGSLNEYAPSAGGYGDDRCSLSHGVARSFTLLDGSVIWGWWSIDEMSPMPREAYFAGLEFGGALPKLPIEFNALKPGGEPSEVTYWGYHLAYTRTSYVDKGEILTEWALYVPDGTPPETVAEYDYDALYVFNLDHTPRLRLGLPVPYGRRIETAEDFERWVLPEIAETSEDGEPPEGL
ncbi:MAG: hypothetical protein JSW27_16550, partial [Phycisphaerales bacterium]